MSIAARRFFQFLLDTKEPPQALVAELENIAKEKYRTTDQSVSLKKLVGWAKLPGKPGSLVVKKWAYAAALDMCLKRGYKPQTEEELQEVIRTWLGYHLHSTLEEAKADFFTHVKISAELQTNAQKQLEEYFQKQS